MKASRIIFVSAVFLTVMGGHESIRAQGCCGAGASLASAGFPVLERGTLMVTLGRTHTRAENPERLRDDGAFGLAYGVTDRLAVAVRSGYAWLKSSYHQDAVYYQDDLTNQTYLLFPDSTIRYNNRGLGDGDIGAQFAVIPMDVIGKREFKAGVDIGIPWGPYRNRSNGTELPQNVQSGTGGYTAGAYVSYAKSLPMHRLAGSLAVNGRLFFTNRRGETPGDQIGGSATAAYGPLWIIRINGTLNAQITRPGYDARGNEIVSLSGKRLDFAPGIELAFSEHLKATASMQFPLWRDIYQEKTGSTLGWQGSLLAFIPVVRR